MIVIQGMKIALPVLTASLVDLLNFSAARLKNKPSCCGETSGVYTHYINIHVFLPLQMASKEMNCIKTLPVSSPWLLSCSFPYIISNIPGNRCLLKAILVAAIIFCLISCLPSVKWMNKYCWFHPFSSDSSPPCQPLQPIVTAWRPRFCPAADSPEEFAKAEPWSYLFPAQKLSVAPSFLSMWHFPSINLSNTTSIVWLLFFLLSVLLFTSYLSLNGTFLLKCILKGNFYL